MFLENCTKFIKYYGKGKKLKLVGFTVLSFIAGLIELVGVSLIYPFVLLIVNPHSLRATKVYGFLGDFLNIHNSTILALLIGAFVLFVFIFKNLFMVGILYLQTKFTSYWRRDISALFMRFFFNTPYKNVMKISESDKVFYVTTMSNQVVDGFVVRLINLVINVIIMTMIIAFLVWKFPIAAIVTIVFVAASMFVQNKFFKKKTTEIADKMYAVQKEYNNVLMQNVHNLKELKILSLEGMFYDKYYDSDARLRKLQIEQLFYGSIPPYIVECFVVISLLLLGGMIAFQNGKDSVSLIASFAVVVASLFRIAPALNRIQTSLINITSNRDFVNRIIEFYEKHELSKLKKYEKVPIYPMKLDRNIEIKDVCFSYDKKPVLRNVSLEIRKGEFVGIVGLSGAGKTTLADVLMGLLPADSGKILMDGKELDAKTFPSFRRLVGYVTQDVRVFETSFRENVAWGVDKDEIDDNLVRHALEQAKLYDFVMTYDKGIYAKPIVGTTGLSQGQKQRLAIARALYRNPEILILDEATSALDVVVENEITEVLNSMADSRTIIAIAHRLSTLKSCDKLIYLKDGVVVDIGTFEELSMRYEDFEKLVKLSTISEKK